jgi:hypothetical protein
MNRMKRLTGVALAAASLLLLAGCVENPADAEMSENPEVWGYVASADNAQLEVTAEQMDVDVLVVDRVLSPGDAWLVVHLDDNGKPGMRIGLAPVKKGESTNVEVELEEVMTDKVIVALHADRATRGEFDFDMMAPTMSPDRPYFVDEEELARVVQVRRFGVPTDEGTAAVEVSDQLNARESLTIDRALAPTGAWVVVHLDDEGAPGGRVGLQHIAAGDNREVVVKLDPLPLTDTLFVAIHADRGEPDLFEFNMMNKINSPDQPFFVGDEEVAAALKVR